MDGERIPGQIAAWANFEWSSSSDRDVIAAADGSDSPLNRDPDRAQILQQRCRLTS